jgi:hypothetical protein
MRGLVQTTGEITPGIWQRFLDIHLAGMRAAGPLSSHHPQLPPASNDLFGVVSTGALTAVLGQRVAGTAILWP